MNNLVQYSDAPKYLNKIHESVPQEDNGSVLNKNCRFVVENYGLVKMMYIKFTIVPNGVTTCPIPTSPFLIENVFLECNGMPIARTNTTYTLNRIENSPVVNLTNQFLEASTISGGSFTDSATISMPLFFWTIDGQLFNPGLYKNLCVRVVTKSSIASMGFNVLPLSLSVKLVTIYNQGSNFKLECPPLKNPYNITQDVLNVAGGNTSVRTALNNPSKIKALIIMARNQSDASISSLITQVKVDTTTQTLGIFDNLTNMTISTPGNSSSGATFRVQFDEFIKMNRNMNPVFITVFGNFLSASNLFIVYEYESEIEDSNGMLMETFSQKII